MTLHNPYHTLDRRGNKNKIVGNERKRNTQVIASKFESKLSSLDIYHTHSSVHCTRNGRERERAAASSSNAAQRWR